MPHHYAQATPIPSAQGTPCFLYQQRKYTDALTHRSGSRPISDVRPSKTSAYESSSATAWVKHVSMPSVHGRMTSSSSIRLASTLSAWTSATASRLSPITYSYFERAYSRPLPKIRRRQPPSVCSNSSIFCLHKPMFPGSNSMQH